MKACPAKKGDYLEFFAEIDLLCALSTCPGGDLSLPMVLASLDLDLYLAPRSDVAPVAEQRSLGPRAAGGFERRASPPLDEGSST